MEDIHSLAHPAPKSSAGTGYVATIFPIVAHYQDMTCVDRTLCGCRVRYRLRPEDMQRRQMSVCHTCQRIVEERDGAI